MLSNNSLAPIFSLTLFERRLCMRNRIILAFITLIAFSSCEDSMFLKSEKKMKEDLQGTWLRNFQGINPYFKCSGDSIFYDEYWTFKDDKLYTTINYDQANNCDKGTADSVTSDAIDTVIVSTFKIDTRIFNAYLKLQLVSGGSDSGFVFVDKWEFITLDDEVLYLATDDPKGNSVLQVEFLKVK